MMAGNYDKSPIDDMFKELYGFYPNKAGQAYEMIVAAAFKLLLDKDVSYDQRLTGEYSRTSYQLDGLIHDHADNTMVEAKDYTILKGKVGRGDLQKLQGALTDLPVGWGVFASATGYTSPAKKYAASSEINPSNKSIQLFNIRPSTIADESGRIKTIVIEIHSFSPNFAASTMTLVWTDEGRRMLSENGYVNKTISLKLDRFYKPSGDILITIPELTAQSPVELLFEDETHIAKGCWIVRGCVNLDGSLYPIHGVEYAVPAIVDKRELVVEGEGNPRLYIRSEDGSIDKLISDADLKKVQFTNGRVIKR